VLLYFLGTGAGRPSLRRNVTSTALKLPEPNKAVWLFDCGEGTQHQLLSSPFSLQQVTKIFITHLHGDHIFGLPGLLGSRSFITADVGLTVYGPPGIAEFLECAIAISSTHLRYPFQIQEVDAGETIDLDGWKVKTALLDHGLTSYGYRVEEPPRPGKLKVEELQRLNIPPGPLYGQLKRGETVFLEDGRVLHGRDFVEPPVPGRCVVILGDTRFSPAAALLAQDADVLVHEATFEAQLAENARAYYHSTTVQGARVAVQANARKLVLSHISSRYRPQDYDLLLSEAQAVFPSTILAEDHLALEIPRHR
jgi:ribonuclease Z